MEGEQTWPTEEELQEAGVSVCLSICLLWFILPVDTKHTQLLISYILGSTIET